jgi:hypothetical protein
MARAMTSELPPGGNVMMRRIGLDGYVSAAAHVAATVRSAAAIHRPGFILVLASGIALSVAVRA